MNFKYLTIVLDKNDTYQTLIDKIKITFRFPDVFGNNINALIERFFFLIFEEETFANFFLHDDEILVLQLTGLSDC